VIDDSDVARLQIGEILRSAGFAVQLLPSAIGATRAVLRSNVDVVLIDISMPAMRGDHLAMLFRKNPRFDRIGLLLVSGEPEVHLERIAKEAGADGMISKSRLDRLVSTIERIAKRRVRSVDG
jgi:CheY-like chemotaxis protein